MAFCHDLLLAWGVFGKQPHSHWPVSQHLPVSWEVGAELADTCPWQKGESSRCLITVCFFWSNCSRVYLQEILVSVKARLRAFCPCPAVCCHLRLWSCVVKRITGVTWVKYNSLLRVICGADPEKHKLAQPIPSALPKAEAGSKSGWVGAVVASVAPCVIEPWPHAPEVAAWLSRSVPGLVAVQWFFFFFFCLIIWILCLNSSQLARDFIYLFFKVLVRLLT